MSRRLQLHEKFVNILGTRGQKETRVYFQPPSNVKLSYPAIIYKRSQIKSIFADDLMYSGRDTYTVTVIDSNPDSIIPNKIIELPLCKFNNAFPVDNLNHTVFTIYY